MQIIISVAILTVLASAFLVVVFYGRARVIGSMPTKMFAFIAILFTSGLDVPLFLRNLIFYAVAGSVLWVIAQRLGAGIGVALAASLLLPPLALLSYTLYRNRGPLL